MGWWGSTGLKSEPCLGWASTMTTLFDMSLTGSGLIWFPQQPYKEGIVILQRRKLSLRGAGLNLPHHTPVRGRGKVGAQVHSAWFKTCVLLSVPHSSKASLMTHSSWELSGNPMNLSEAKLPPVWNRDNNTYVTGLLWGSKNRICVECGQSWHTIIISWQCWDLKLSCLIVPLVPSLYPLHPIPASLYYNIIHGITDNKICSSSPQG